MKRKIVINVFEEFKKYQDWMIAKILECQKVINEFNLKYEKKAYEDILEKIKELNCTKFEKELDKINKDEEIKTKIINFFEKTKESFEEIFPKEVDNLYQYYDNLLQYFSFKIEMTEKIIKKQSEKCIIHQECPEFTEL